MTGEDQHPDHERRLSTVEANYGNLAGAMGRIEGYLGQLFTQQGEIKTGLALVVQNQDHMNEYQKKCDADRTDHDKRITVVEGFHRRVIKSVVAITGIGSLASPQLAKIWEKIFS